MSLKIKVAFWCNLIASVLIGLSGMIYLVRTQFMPYHAVAVGKAWDQVDPAFQLLIMGLIRVFGGASLAIASAMVIVLMMSFRKGVRWARWMVPAVGLVYSAASLYVTIDIALNTSAKTPWPIVGSVAILLLIGLLLSIGTKDTSKE